MEPKKYEGQDPIKHTKKDKSYWSNTGAYSEELKKLEFLIPPYGYALTFHGELIRCVSNLYYERMNNGNCNAQDTIYDDDDNIVKIEITEKYKEHLEQLKEITTNEDKHLVPDLITILAKVEESLTTEYNDKYDRLYEEMVDNVMYFVLNTEDTPY